MKKYVVKRENAYWIGDTRVSLDSIVYEFRKGASPESIQRSFPVLTLEEVYGALTFYLANYRKVDEYLRRSETEYERQTTEWRREMERNNPEFLYRFERPEVTAH